MAQTERARCTATVKDREGDHFIVLEAGEPFTIATRGMISLDLRRGVTYEQAKALTKMFNDVVEGVAITFEK
jgi:hypothetical protein